MAQTFVDQSAIAAARDAFLTSGVESPDVRAETLRAWKRSLAAGAGATAIPPRLRGESANRDTALLRAVEPVATAMMQRLRTADFAMVVTDRQARVAGRWVTNRWIATLLDGLGTVIGASFDEAHVGSTGLGTVLEDRAISIVDGAEHLNRRFDPVLAVGAPIIHPATGHTEGALDLVCPTGIRPETLVALVEHAAREAAAGLLSGFAAQDRALLDAFLQWERRGPRRPVLALNRRIMLTNPRAGSLLGGYPHDLLWRDVEAALETDRMHLELVTETGTPLGGSVRPITAHGSVCGAILRLYDLQPVGIRRRTGSEHGVADSIASDLLRILPGRSLLWHSTIKTAAQATSRGGRLLIIGGPGCGKSALADTLAEVVPRHLSDAGRPMRCRVFEDAAEPLPEEDWRSVVVATTQCSSRRDLAEWQLATFEYIVRVPQLMERAEDIADIAPVIVAALSGNRVCLTGEALTELAQRQWRGNIRHLQRVLRAAVAGAPGSMIRRQDIPAEIPSASTYVKLTYLENVERNAIAELLTSTGGNKRQVADILGVSRATLYRKLAALHLT